MTLRSMACCGLRELIGLSEYGYGPSADAMKDFVRSAMTTRETFNYRQGRYVRTRRHLNFSHVVFSDAAQGDGPYGARFAAFIKRSKLGDVVASQRRVNPNSDNPLKVWVWTINKTNLKAWAKKHP